MTKRLLLSLLLIISFLLPLEAFAQPQTELQLTNQERAFIAEHNTIKVLVDPDWYPYESLTPEGHYNGIAADLLRLIFKRAGLSFEVLPSENWEDSIKKAKNREADVLSLLNQTPERSKWLIFTEPYYTDANVIITRNEHDYVSNLSFLQNETIVLPAQTSVVEQVKRDYPNLRVLEVESETQAIDMVNKGEADLTLRSLTMAAYIIKNQGYFNLKVAGEVTAYKNELRMGLIQDNPILLSILNKAIATLTPEDIQKAVNDHISIEIKKGFDYQLFFIVFGAFSLCLIVIVVWSQKVRQLNRHLKSREVELTKLSERFAQGESLYRSILTASPDAIVLSTLNGDVLMASPAVVKVVGVSEPSELYDKKLIDYIDETDKLRFTENLNRLSTEVLYGTRHYQGINAAGESVMYEVSSERICDEFGVPVRIVSVIRDVTQRHEMENTLKVSEQEARRLAKELEEANQILKQTATLDNLTGIKNRYYFDQKLPEALKTAEQNRAGLGLLILDLDRFKLVNDRFGHDRGDEVLRKIVQTVKGHIRRSDLFARWGGEEFVVLLPGIDLERIKVIAEKIRHAVEKTMHEEVGEVTISIGASVWDYKESALAWFVRTDKVLYRAKREGRNRVEVSGDSVAINNVIHWSDEWECGNELIDSQHRDMLKIGNELIASAIEGESHQVQAELLERLMLHIAQHFKDEEAILSACQYEALAEHLDEHNMLLLKASALMAEADQGVVGIDEVLHYVVGDVLTKHMLNEDVKFFGLFAHNAS